MFTLYFGELNRVMFSVQEWDLDALESTTHYDGFDVNHPVIM